jgi:hypothetical protein
MRISSSGSTDGRPAWPEIRKMGTDAAQVDEPLDRSKKVILGNVVLTRKLVEQGRLRFLPRTHHRHSSHPLAELNQHDAPRSSASFSTEYASLNRCCAHVQAGNGLEAA